MKTFNRILVLYAHINENKTIIITSINIFVECFTKILIKNILVIILIDSFNEGFYLSFFLKMHN